VLQGCGGFTAQPLPLPPRAVRLASFKFTPPDEFGWMSAPASQWGFAARREGPGRDDLYALLAEAEETPHFTTDQEFLEAGRGAFAVPPEDPGRFTVKNVDLALWPRLGARCLRGVLDGRDGEMVLASALFICVNPHLPSQSIMLTLTQRCEPGHEDPELIQKAEALAATLEFL
jgi:hypothetical protein